jgi:hypothetical protein
MPPIAGHHLVKTADPYSTLVLSPYDDPYIPAASIRIYRFIQKGTRSDCVVTGKSAYAFE